MRLSAEHLDRQIERNEMNYTHLAEEERYQIQALLDVGMSVTAIAVQINHHKSTISRELGN
ncbi:MAG: hypothetical protein A3H31_03215 [Gallionellales bacterium RIFCSPLOWO2_02_FULL_57_47]|nr:MAG: hypothetical protein A3H31_03215 [Gallionellales bacterium RIFCSPLOWO2_02_FULL_57_47]